MNDTWRKNNMYVHVAGESDFKFAFLRHPRRFSFPRRGGGSKTLELGECGYFSERRGAPPQRYTPLPGKRRSPLDIAVKNITFTQVGQFRHGRAPV